ncbi:MAG: DUF6489 family protein [Mangrovicoccus sp.]|nr:DUF6489 family protein [Mangrovicoccus sp.]
MKVKIDVDMTPMEARELLGLPDVRPLQELWLSRMNGKMEEHLEQLTPEGMVQAWIKAASGNAEWMTELMKLPGFMARASKDD